MSKIKKLICYIFGHSLTVIKLKDMTHVHKHLVKIFVTKCKVCGYRIKVEDEKGTIIYGEL